MQISVFTPPSATPRHAPPPAHAVNTAPLHAVPRHLTPSHAVPRRSTPLHAAPQDSFGASVHVLTRQDFCGKAATGTAILDGVIIQHCGQKGWGEHRPCLRFGSLVEPTRYTAPGSLFNKNLNGNPNGIQGSVMTRSVVRHGFGPGVVLAYASHVAVRDSVVYDTLEFGIVARQVSHTAVTGTLVATTRYPHTVDPVASWLYN